MTADPRTEERHKAASEPCRCVTCGSCNGTGHIRYSNNQFDLDDTEPCDDCSGGISETCDRCQLLREMDFDA